MELLGMRTKNTLAKKTLSVMVSRPVIPFFAGYFIISLLFVPGFANLANISAIFMQAAFLCILACGLTFVFINGGFDFSLTGIMGLGSIVGALIMQANPNHVGAAVAVMLLIGIGIGCLNGLSVTLLRMPSFIATMSTQLVFSGLALWLTKSTTIAGLPKGFIFLGQGSILGIPAPILFMALIVAVAVYVLNGTVYGRYLMAVGTNQKASRVSGIPVERTIFSVFLISGLFAGIAAVLMSARVASGIPMLGDGMIMDIVAAVLIGGTSLLGGNGTIIGTLLGSILVISLNNSLYLAGVEWYVINIIKGLVILLVAVLDVLKNRKTD